MVDYVFLERVAHLVDEVHVYIGIARVHLAATLVDGHEHRLNAAGGLRHQRGGACRRNGQAGYVAAAVAHHVVVELRGGLLQSQDERVLLFTLGVVYLEGTALAGHLHTRTVGGQGQRAVYLDREVGGLLRTVAQSHSGNHVALGGDAHSRAAALAALGLDFLPQVTLGTLHLHRLRVAVNLCDNLVYLLQLQVHDVVHQPLGCLDVLLERVEVEAGLCRKRVLHVAVEVDAQQAARVVGTERYLTAGVGRDGTEPQVGIAVGDALAQDGVPEQHTRLGTLPSIVDYLLPQLLGRNLPTEAQISLLAPIDGPLLHVGLVVDGAAHELVVNLHADVGAGHLALGHLRIDERLGLGVPDADAEHQRTTPSVLRHLARTITISLHERHQSGGGQGRVVHRRTLRAYVTQVVAHAAAPLHQLHLLLVNAHHGTVGVGIAVESDDEAVRQRGYLVVVADARHGAAGRDDVAEVVEQTEYLVLRHRVLVLLLYAGYLAGYPSVHVLGRALVDLPEAVLHGILVHPHAGSQLVALKVVHRGLKRLLVGICLLRFHNLQ